VKWCRTPFSQFGKVGDIVRLRIDDVTARQQGLQVFLDRLLAVKGAVLCVA